MITVLSRRAFDGTHLHRLASPSNKVLASRNALKVTEMTYRPGAPRFVDDALNTWRRSTLVPVAGPHPLIEGLLDHLLPNALERNHALDMLGFHAQRPGIKIRHSMILRGPPGSGKNTLVDRVFPLLWGRGNVKALGGEAILSRFNSEYVNIQILAVDEVMHRDGWEVVNRLKPLLSEDRIWFEAKGEARREGTTPRMVFFLSNDPSPLPVEVGDRRFFVPEYGPPRLDAAFYDQLHLSVDTEAAGFLAALLARDVSAFNPNAAPPMTAAKGELQASVRPPLERQLREWSDEAYGPFARDIVVPREVLTEARAAGHSHATDGAIKRALQEMGAVSLGQLPPGLQGGAGRPRVWAVRNFDEWSAAMPAAWLRHLTTSSPHQNVAGRHLAGVPGGGAGPPLELLTAEFLNQSSKFGEAAKREAGSDR